LKILTLRAKIKQKYRGGILIKNK